LIGHAATASRLADKAMAPAAVGVVEKVLDRAGSAGVVVDKATSPAALAVAERLLSMLGEAELTALLDAGLDRRTLGLLAATAKAAAETRGGGSPEPLGPFGTLRALSDPDVMRASGFLFAFARAFGRSLDQVPAR
jgi:uncharacterized protein YjgD (DUF1641 family)